MNKEVVRYLITSLAATTDVKKMSYVPPPDLWQMIDAYTAAKDAGLRNVKLGNVPLFVKTREEHETVEKIVGRKNDES